MIPNILFSSAQKFEASPKAEDAKVQVREKADIKAKLEEARQRRLALENSRYGHQSKGVVWVWMLIIKLFLFTHADSLLEF